MSKNYKNLLFACVLMLSWGACSSLRQAESGFPTPRKLQTNKTTYKDSSVDTNYSTLRSDIVRTARKYKGTKYRTGGENPRGFDCSGYTSYVLKKHGVDIARSSRSQATQGRKISVKKAKPGDLLFFGGGGKVSHVAIVTENKNGKLKMIHSTTSKGVVENELYSSNYWKSRLKFAKRIVQE